MTYERRRILKDQGSKSSTKAHRRRYGLCFRYIDDLPVLNCPGFNPSDVYPKKLIVKDETRIPGRATSFLDLDIRVTDGSFTFSLYGKRRDFNFPVNQFMHAKSCVPPKTKLGVMKSQVKRTSRACLRKSDCNRNLDMLRAKFIERGFGAGAFSRVSK